MFIINIHYTAPIKRIDECLAKHRTWLDKEYQAGHLLCSGPKNPRDGGVIIALSKNRADVEEMIKHDPFYLHQVAEYTITEFVPVKWHKSIENLV